MLSVVDFLKCYSLMQVCGSVCKQRAGMSFNLLCTLWLIKLKKHHYYIHIYCVLSNCVLIHVQEILIFLPNGLVYLHLLVL